jgi:hypothetical protein
MAVALLSFSRIAARRMIVASTIRLISAQLERRGFDVRRAVRRIALVAAGIAAAWVACVALVVALAIHFL